MKAEHRHELKTNELAQWLADFPDWVQKNLKTIIYIAVVVILVAAAYIWKKYEKNVLMSQRQINFTNSIRSIEQQRPRILQAASQGTDLSYVLLQSPDQLKTIAKDTKNDDMAALSEIKEGQAIRMGLHYRLQMPSEDEKLQQLNRAREAYTKAIERTPNTNLLAQAKFGLGLCEEELGNFQQAREIYNEMAENADFIGLVTANMAKERLAVLQEYEQPVTFKAMPPMPQLQEQIQPTEPMFGPFIQPEAMKVPEVNQPTP